MARISEQERLGRLSKLLRAERNPYYVRFPLPPTSRMQFPAEGWYWVPAGQLGAQLLARDAFDAYHRLMCLLEAIDEEIPDGNPAQGSLA